MFLLLRVCKEPSDLLVSLVPVVTQDHKETKEIEGKWVFRDPGDFQVLVDHLDLQGFLAYLFHMKMRLLVLLYMLLWIPALLYGPRCMKTLSF